MIFSKDYCPFCKKVKNLFKENNTPIKVIELDLIDDGEKLHQHLKKIANQNTVPVVYIGGKKLGGCDDTLNAAKNGTLKMMLDEAGVSNSFEPQDNRFGKT